MAKSKNGSLQAVAEQVLGRRVNRSHLTEPAELAGELGEQLHAGRAGGDTVTVAQAIVLAIGRRALDGDKSAAEYLQKLADQQEEKREYGEGRDLVIRVRLNDSDGATAEVCGATDVHRPD